MMPNWSRVMRTQLHSMAVWSALDPVESTLGVGFRIRAWSLWTYARGVGWSGFPRQPS